MCFATTLTSLLFLVFLSPIWGCPKQCDCDGNKLKCRIPATTSFPQFHLASNTTLLDLSDNNLLTIPANSLKGLPLLEELILDGNKIYVLENHAFKGSSRLRKISLKNNNIHYIEDEAFTDLSDLEELYLSQNKIFKLPNLQNNTKLTKFCISANMIDTLPKNAFTANQQLSELKMKENQLTSLPRDAFPDNVTNYVTLNVIGNKILSFPPVVKEMTELENLMLCRNPLKTFKNDDFAPFQKLKFLAIYDVGLTEFAPQVSKLSNLEELHVGKNNIVGNSFDNLNLPNLQILDVKDNKVEMELKGYYFNGVPNIVKLDLSHSKVAMTPKSNFFPFDDLKELYLQNNRLSELPFLIQNGKLQILNLNGNEITKSNLNINTPDIKELNLSNNSMTSLHVDDANSLLSVTSLDLSHNMFENIPDVVMTSMPNLQTLNISFNLLMNLTEGDFQNFSKLTTLNLKSNNLSSIPKNLFANLTNLKNLFLCQNQLKILDADWLASLPHLEVLTVDQNSIEEIEEETFQNNPNLKHVSLNGNQLNKVDEEAFENLRHLEVLKLIYNQLSKPPKLSNNKLLRLVGLCNNPIGNLPAEMFRGLNELQTVLLRKMGLTELPRNVFEDLGQIIYLNLVGNNLTTVPDIIKQMPMLQTLELTGNPIKKVDSRNFVGLNSLRELQMSEMQIRSLDITTLMSTLPALRKLNVESNPWHCGCEMQRFALGVDGERLDVEIEGRDKMMCSSPSSFAGKNLCYFQPGDFRFCEPSSVKDIQSSSVMLSLPVLSIITSPDCDVYNEVSYIRMGETTEQVLKINSSKSEMRIHDLRPDTQYLICVQPTSSDKRTIDELFLEPRQTCHKLKTAPREGKQDGSTAIEATKEVTSQNLIIIYAVLGGALAFVVIVTVIASSVWCRNSQLEKRKYFSNISSIPEEINGRQVGVKGANGQNDGFGKGHVNLSCDVIGQNARTKL